MHFPIEPGWTTRFAPAPTGWLHLGHVVNAAYVWGLARAFGGRVLLRIEDHDRARCRPEYEAGLLDDLDWLGFVPDRGDTREFRAGPHPQRQSDAGARYERALARLVERGLVYACDCSRRSIAEATPVAEGEEPRYTNRCRERGLDFSATAARRILLDDGEECFDDLRLGPQSQSPARQCGDLLARDRLGYWTYQFAVTVDDLEQGVDVIIRGEDLLESTGRQFQLARLLGRERMPRVLHHPLLRKPGGQKLSKSAGDTGVRDLRAAGMTPAQVIGRAVHLAGLTERERPVAVDDLPSLFAEG
ncbi:MAG TPA: glutamate--tRNA ligase family protein [Gemmatimonadales bacterium]|nr:glutamate--tRNA ligase family protein [Gemmatimonadales bacterium]